VKSACSKSLAVAARTARTCSESVPKRSPTPASRSANRLSASQATPVSVEALPSRALKTTAALCSLTNPKYEMAASGPTMTTRLPSVTMAAESHEGPRGQAARRRWIGSRSMATTAAKNKGTASGRTM